MEITGFVISRTPIKEQDAMIQVLAPSGLFSFFARHAMDYKSDVQSSTTPFTYGIFTLKEGPQGGLSLSQARLIKSHSPKNDSLVHFALFELISEVLTKVVHQEETALLYPYLESILISMQHDGDPLTMSAIFLAAGLTSSGLRMQIDECVICQKTEEIVGVSISNGGLVCRNCFDHKEMTNESVNVLKNLRYCFLIPCEKMDKFVIEKVACKRILNILFDHFLQQMGKKLGSVELILKT